MKEFKITDTLKNKKRLQVKVLLINTYSSIS